jgi:hypothetical protein
VRAQERSLGRDDLGNDAARNEAAGSQRYPPLLGLGRPSRGGFIAFVSNLRSWPLLRRAVALWQAASDFPIEYAAVPGFVPGVAWSDHASFWEAGYRAFMVTDTAFYRNPYYHTAGDSPDTLDYRQLTRVVEGLCAIVAGLAET